MFPDKEGFHRGGNQIWLIEVHMIGGSSFLNAAEEINQKCVLSYFSLGFATSNVKQRFCFR